MSVHRETGYLLRCSEGLNPSGGEAMHPDCLWYVLKE